MKLAKYVDWARRQVTTHAPAVHTTVWVSNWGNPLTALLSSGGIFEVVSLVISRWEFLGSLVRGKATGSTNETDARTYTERFLEPMNERYRTIHGSARAGSKKSEFYTMFRDRPLHGMTPAGVLHGKNKDDVLTWWMGVDDIETERHLVVDPDGAMHVSGRLLVAELLASMGCYIEQLARDDEARCRWRRGFWMRHSPHNMDPKSWYELRPKQEIK